MRSVHRLFVILFASSLVFMQTADAKSCNKVENPAEKQACEDAAQAKAIAKLRKRTTPFMPSQLGKGLASLDQNNPLDRDQWYVGVRKDVGIPEIDKLAKATTRLEAAVTLANFTVNLSENGKTERARGLAKTLLPIVTKAPGEAKTITLAIKDLDVMAIAKGTPLLIPAATRSVSGSTRRAARVIKETPPLVKALTDLTSEVKVDAVVGATGDALEAELASEATADSEDAAPTDSAPANPAPSDGADAPPADASE